ncbi:MAG: hypothetical protein Q8P54_01815 [bacterium]|nr:hypothetical protein [bacterium]
MTSPNLIKKLLLAAAAVIILGVIAYFIYFQFFFFVTSTNPNNGTRPNILLKEVKINFNKKLLDENKNRVVVQPFMEKEIVVNDGQITIKLKDPIKINQKYTVNLYDIKSTDNKIIKYYSFSFTGSEIDDNTLSRMKKQEMNNEENENINNKNFDEFLLSLPVENLRYKITYSFPNGTSKPPQYQIILYAILNRPDQYDEYYRQLRDYKKEALDYFRANGKDPTKLDIRYEPSEAANY